MNNVKLASKLVKLAKMCEAGIEPREQARADLENKFREILSILAEGVSTDAFEWRFNFREVENMAHKIEILAEKCLRMLKADSGY